MILNPIGLDGIEFLEFSSPFPAQLEKLFIELGFSRLQSHKKHAIDLYQQNDIAFLVNRETGTASEKFYQTHGPCVSAMGWRVKDAKMAMQTAISRGAQDATSDSDYQLADGTLLPALRGIGGSLLYLVEDSLRGKVYPTLGFTAHTNPIHTLGKGFLSIDHLTNNVENGTMAHWSNFYKNIFGFTEIRYFDIRGIKTGLTSFALKSPCGKFCIPINEATESKSQINEYLQEYKGPGVQHIAFLTEDILGSLDKMNGTSISTLDIDDDYYATIYDRLPQVTEDREKIKQHQVLLDGDEEGYLLQIFTKNIIGPIFIEFIQRKNHHAFGEGNFGALFRAIERDQEKRGFL
jgi:4-hydroxyphenylpyruvate dioxygenase